jgi:hypothetical protein
MQKFLLITPNLANILHNKERKPKKKSQLLTQLVFSTTLMFLGKAVAIALSKAPGLNGRIVMGRYLPNKTVDMSFLVSVEGGKNLAQAKLTEVDK